MNTVRMISRLLIVTVVVSVGSVCAMKDNAMQMAASNQQTGIAIAVGTGLPEGADAAKAALETMGYIADHKDADVSAVVTNFVLNYGLRKFVRCLDKNGYNLKTAEDAINKVPAVGTHVGPVLTGAVKAAAPQIFAGIVVGLTNSAAKTN
jgi:hypothetical protein